MLLITRVVAEDGTDNLKAPLSPVTVFADVPLAKTETPRSGVPSCESATLPVTIIFCAIAGIMNKHKVIRQLSLTRFLKCIAVKKGQLAG